jgi:arylsulfate sulfotransferase
MGTTIKSKRPVVTALLIAIAATIGFYFVYRAVGHLRTQRSRKFHFEVSIKDTSQGYLLLSPYVPTQPRYSLLVIMDLRGNVILEKHVEGIVSDFRQWNINGNNRYSYLVYEPDIDPGDFIHGSMAHAVILDSALNEIKQVHLLSHNDIVVNKTNGIDHHDFIMLADDHFITISSYVKRVGNIPESLLPAAHVRVIAPIIQEIKNGAVIWQWDGTAFPEFYLNSTKGNKYSDSANAQDYAHINSIVIDPHDSNLIVSFHNTNQIVKINRQSGDITWRLGGKNSDFPLTAKQVFLRQHHPTFTDSGRTLMLFDNGDSTLRPTSRVLEFRLDEQRKEITYFSAYIIPEAFAESKGSVQLADNNYFICGGSANYLLEVNRKTGDKKMELHYNQTSFRAYFVRDVPGIKTLKEEN